jgi:mannose-6-phosphate isomerase-like protein (cupin superfamily)
MGAIRFASPDDIQQITPNGIVSEEQAKGISEGVLNTKVRYYHPGSDSELQMFEVTMPPNAVGPQHAHEESEIIYVVAGEIIFGRRVLGAGSSVYIPGRTLYKFDTGPEGVTFLNFRARQDMTYYSRDDMASEAKARHARHREV